MEVTLDFRLVRLRGSTICNSKAFSLKKFFCNLSDFVKIQQFLEFSKFLNLCLHFWKSILNHRKPSKIKSFFPNIDTKTYQFLFCIQTELMLRFSTWEFGWCKSFVLVVDVFSKFWNILEINKNMEVDLYNYILGRSLNFDFEEAWCWRIKR